jgi:transcription elongation GreA/GreB family factor
METISKFLPTAEMQTEFEQYKKLKTDKDRAEYQEYRANRLEQLTVNERIDYISKADEGLKATINATEEFIMLHKLGEIAQAK